MIGQIIGFAIAVGAVALGVKGFKPEGLPLTRHKTITGRPARIIGGVCIAFGLLLGLAQAAILVLHQMVRQGMIPPMKDW